MAQGGIQACRQTPRLPSHPLPRRHGRRALHQRSRSSCGPSWRTRRSSSNGTRNWA
jgi:hypothetical protein